MAVIDFHSPVSKLGAFGHRALHVPAQLAKLLLDWRRTRRTRSELSKLSDRNLRDIGLTRDMIEDYKIGSKRN